MEKIPENYPPKNWMLKNAGRTDKNYRLLPATFAQLGSWNLAAKN
uniref:Uncharacterized protein n=1 Tax=Romanomermis culicivorax TaxID=13658 RepID=A0A915IYD5_ROMCU